MQRLLEIAKAEETNFNFSAAEKKVIEAEIADLKAEDIEPLYKAIWPVQQIGREFYEKLNTFVFNLGLSNNSYKLGARLWAYAYKRLDKQIQPHFLQSLLDSKNKGFWIAITMMPYFFSQVDINPEVAEQWFVDLYKRVKDDLAAGPYYDGIAEYGKSYPVSALSVIRSYIKKLDEGTVVVASILLAGCRSQEVVHKEVLDIDNGLRNDPRVLYRICYFRALPTSFNLKATSISELKELLDVMLQGEKRESDEAFKVISGISISNRNNKDVIEFAVQWLKGHIQHAKSDEAKYYVVNMLWLLCSGGAGEIRHINMDDAYDLLVEIQPIPLNNKGTWDLVEQFLFQRIQEGASGFEQLLDRLIEKYPEGILNLFDSEDRYLGSEMKKLALKRIVTNYVVSKNPAKRRLSKILFNKLDICELDNAILENVDNKLLTQILYESIRYFRFEKKKGAIYLVAIGPLYRKAPDEIKTMFKGELYLQAINYPGNYLEYFKTKADTSILIKEVVQDGERYFECFKSIRDLPAISFSFPEYHKANELARREWSNKIRQGVEKRSLFAKLAKNYQIIYGSKWSIYQKGKLAETSGFSEIHEEMELPRLELIDPEGMTLRRIRAGIYNSLLEKENDAI